MKYQVDWQIYGTVFVEANSKKEAKETADDMSLKEMMDRSGALVYGPEYSVSRTNE
jgi:hypothetical protein